MRQEPVIAGVDESPESLAAAEWAAREALRREVPLRLLHVWEWAPPLSAPVPDDTSQREWAERIVREARNYLTARYPRLDLGGEPREGNPAGGLLEAASDAGLLVLGSRGLGRISGFLVGSVAFKVVAHVGCPTVLVRDVIRTVSEEPAAGPAEEVVVGVDLAQRSDDLLEFAFEESRLRDRGVHVLHSYLTPLLYGLTGYSVEADMDQELAAEHRSLLEREVRPWQRRYPDVTVRMTVVPGQAAATLLDAAAEASLLVIGRRERTVLPNLGSVAHAVMHHATCPVAVVPHEEG